MHDDCHQMCHKTGILLIMLINVALFPRFIYLTLRTHVMQRNKSESRRVIFMNASFIGFLDEIDRGNYNTEALQNP